MNALTDFARRSGQKPHNETVLMTDVADVLVNNAFRLGMAKKFENGAELDLLSTNLGYTPFRTTRAGEKYLQRCLHFEGMSDHQV